MDDLVLNSIDLDCAPGVNTGEMNDVLYEIIVQSLNVNNTKTVDSKIVKSLRTPWVDTAANKNKLLTFVRDSWQEVISYVKDCGIVNKVLIRVSIGNIGMWSEVPQKYYKIIPKKDISKFDAVFMKMAGTENKIESRPVVDDNTSQDIKAHYLIFFLDNVVGKVNWVDNVKQLILKGYVDYRYLTSAVRSQVTDVWLQRLNDEKITFSEEYRLSKYIPQANLDTYVRFAMLKQLNYVFRLFTREFPHSISIDSMVTVLQHSIGTEDFAWGCASLTASNVLFIGSSGLVSTELMDLILQYVSTDVIRDLITHKVSLSNNPKVVARFEYQKSMM